MAMLQGNTYLIPFVIEDCDGNVITEKQIEKGEFVFGEIVKYYGVDGGVYWDEEKQVFVLPLSERETFSLQRAVKYQGRVLLKNGTVSGSKPESEYVYESLGTTILSDVESAGEESGKMLRVKLLDRVVDIGGVSDYNDLDNKPSIGGVVVEGEKSIEDYGGATKNYVDERFNGANKSVSFVNYSLMISSLNSLGNASYNVGQNIMIVTLNVPDLWVIDVAETSVVYSYVSDDDFVSELKTNGSVQVGYYVLGALETQKVDLTDYVKNTDYATSDKGGVVKVNETYGTRMVSGVLDLMPAQYSLIDNRQANEYPLYIVTNYTRHMIVPANVDYAVQQALANNKLKGTKHEWTEEQKASARDLLGAVKQINTSGFLRAYGIAGNGAQTFWEIITNASTIGEGRLPRYVSNSSQSEMSEKNQVLSSGTPTQYHHVANKEYVDGLVGDINTALESILGV